MPMTMRSEGATKPPLPSALAGMKAGAARAADAVARKWRRDKPFRREAFICGDIEQFWTRSQSKTFAADQKGAPPGAGIRGSERYFATPRSTFDLPSDPLQ